MEHSGHDLFKLGCEMGRALKVDTKYCSFMSFFFTFVLAFVNKQSFSSDKNKCKMNGLLMKTEISNAY